jgi:hypothetical protein
MRWASSNFRSALSILESPFISWANDQIRWRGFKPRVIRRESIGVRLDAPLPVTLEAIRRVGHPFDVHRAKSDLPVLR